MTETWRQTRDAKRLDAAARLEELAIIAKGMVTDLRDDGDARADARAYARVYWLRKQVGYVVNNLGYGAPPTWATQEVEREYAGELQHGK